MSESLPARDTASAELEKLECVVRDLHYGYVELDLRGRIVDANRRAQELCGYTLAELREKESFAFVFPPDDLKRVMADLEEAAAEPNDGPREYRIVTRDGTTIDIESNAAPLTREGAHVGFVVTFADISARKSFERELRESEDLHRSLVEALPEAVAKIDLTGRITYVSPRAVQVLGASDPSDLIGIDGMALVAPEMRDVAGRNLMRIIETGIGTNTEYLLLRTDGEVFPGVVSISLLRSKGGEPIEVVVVLRDLSENKRVAEELHRARQERTALAREVSDLRQRIRDQHGMGSIIGNDPKMHVLCERILAVARTDVTVLIQGETGTGKELVASAIHYNSPRSEGPFVKVDCSALAEGLLESELFGHQKGAFTDAVRTRQGRFELAHGGTVFLDEINSTSSALQSRLLRAVEEGLIERVGGEETISVDVRVIAATNSDLTALVAAGSFRKDLFYRLNVVPLVLPPLRDRRVDIALLAQSFVERFARRHARPVKGFSDAAVAALQRYRWPGNVRELENVVEQAVVLGRGEIIEAADLRLPERAAPKHKTTSSYRQALAEGARAAVLAALERAGGNKKLAAEYLGISRSALYAKLKTLGM